MIKVRCLGHIGTSLGAKDVELPDETIDAEDIIARLRRLSTLAEPGFTKYNTLVLVEDREAFVPAGSKEVVRSGQKVVVIPFSHGG